MSLQVWLPLNGSTVNQGISGLTLTGSPASWGTGKIGKCATFANNISNIIYNNTTALNYVDNFSWCLWINTNYTSGTHYAFTVGRADAGGRGYGLLRLSATACRIRYGSGNQSTCDVPVTSGEWTHLAFTKTGNIISIYKNGALYTTYTFGGTAPTYSDGNGLGVGCFHYSNGNIYPFYGSLNDFRIYDHCLSPREVKEIAKGLVCHYPLNDVTVTTSVNKYSGDSFEGKSTNVDRKMTVTKLADERGYNYKLSYTGTGSNNWPASKFPRFSFTAGKKYDYSCKVRCHSCTNVDMTMRCSRIDNDWECPKSATIVSSSLADGKWHEYHRIITLQATSDRSGTTYTTAPLMEFYTNNLVTKDTVYSFDFDLKDVQVSECDVEVPASNGAWKDNVVYDTSGFGNHGTAATASAPTWASDSPRYDGCYAFNGSSQFLKAPQSAKITDEITASIWAYMGTWGGDIRLISCTEGGGWNIESNSDYIVFLVYAGGSYRTCKSSKKWTSLIGGWHHFAVTYNGLKSCLYIDGVLDTSITPFTTKTPITYNSGNTIFIGAEAGSNTTAPVGSYFNGKLSDFRLYATALSAEDIKELYNSPITVTNTGVLMTQGEFKEE